MAAPKKRRVNGQEKEERAESDSSNYSESDSENEVQTEVQVNFEACAPSDNDFHGIKQLLHQLFLKSHINVSQLADLLIQQNFISSVIKQDYEDMETDDDDEEEDVAFGVFSVVNITEKSGMECIQQLKDHLIEQCSNSCRKETFDTVSNILMSKTEHVGLILSERYINIPAQIALPLYQTLNDDIEKAIAKKKPFKFDYFMIISKVLVKAPGSSTDVQFVNSEEELFKENAAIEFDFSVSNEQDSGLSGRWKDDDEEFLPQRKVMILPADKWPNLLTKLKEELSQA